MVPDQQRREVKSGVNSPSPRAQLESFLEKFSPGVATDARAALARLRRLVPGAVELVYDNYNALAVGFGPSERPSEAIVSMAVYPRWVSLFFLHGGPQLLDPKSLLKGSGKKVRHIVLRSPVLLDLPAVRSLLKLALARAPVQIDPSRRRRTVIKSVSAKQRPRRTS